MIKRTVLVLSLLLLPLTATAQMNDAGDIFDVEFEEDMGVGILYNRYWTTNFSTEFAYQKLGADLTLSAGDVAAQVAELDLDILSGTAQLHFARNSIISPYIGGGVAFVSGEAGAIDEDEFESADLENELNFLANAGLNVNLGRSFTLFLDGKYVMYEARGEGDPDDEALDINPLIISGGIKFRF